jgi:hypothetical protein
LANPKVHLTIGDAREVLQTTPQQYDVIFSEPSNPYRAGVASLFTREFYEAAATRLGDGGVFLQFVQSYEVDEQTIRIIYATLASVFTYVETWETEPGDWFLAASFRPLVLDVPLLRARLREEPYRAALADAWHAEGLEGFLSRYVADASFTRVIANEEHEINTDDRTPIEFAFARSVGRRDLFDPDTLRARAVSLNANHPALSGGTVEWQKVEYQRVAGQMATADDVDVASTLPVWRKQPHQPNSAVALAIIAEALADDGDDSALPLLDQLRQVESTQADALLGRLRWRQQQWSKAADALVRTFEQYRDDPWPMERVMRRTLTIAGDVAAHDAVAARRLYRVLTQPFAASVLDDLRRLTAVDIAVLRAPELCADALALLEPHVLWNRDFLNARLQCYRVTHHELAMQAQRDLDEFLQAAPAE